LARAARQEVKVVLCGEGGDEIFAGYGRYRRQARPAWLGGRERNPNGPFTGLGVLLRDDTAWREGLMTAKAAAETPGRTRLQVAQALDCEESLPNCLLTKLDRCLMAHGVEGRTPFLDPRVAELGFLLPERLKLARGRAKVLLRRWLDQRLPEAEPFAKKLGFTVPVGEWILAAGERLGPLMARDPAVLEYCRPERVREIFVSRRGEDQIAAWRLLFFVLWHRRHIRGLRPDGDVFACLASSAA
jgi:asparagine synthase (glutamine-hydrolysing)